MSDENYYQALVTKDPRFDGRIFFGVRTTGIYCRPICPAKTPLRKNVVFFPSSAAASRAGFRPCLRCRPETSPGQPAWIGTSSTVSRALRIINSGETENKTVSQIATRLGIGERHLRRLFWEHLGTTPQSLIQMKRLDLSKQLIEESAAPMSEIAFAVGFNSIRRFNDAFKSQFRRPPSEIRRKKDPSSLNAGVLTLKLPFRPPFDWRGLIDFLKMRAIPGVETVKDDCYRRTISIGNFSGWLEVSPEPKKHALRLTISPPPLSHVKQIVFRVGQLFDLNCDPMAIYECLSKDLPLRPLLDPFTGLRVPGCWDPFELGVRAILGQQISVAGARTLAGRMTEKWGRKSCLEDPALAYLFPTADALAAADLTSIGLTTSRAKCLALFAERIAQKKLSLDPHTDWKKTRLQLLEIPGVGPWTREYIGMRALGDPDAFPETDIVIRRELDRRKLRAAPETWRPWRAYVALYLWRAAASTNKLEKKEKKHREKIKKS